MQMATPAPAKAGGGYRPAYNMQIVSAPAQQVIPACARTAVDLETTGSDRGLAGPALDKLVAAGTKPADYLVDGGFTKNADIERARAGGIRLWCPAAKNKHGTEPYAPRQDDGPGVAAWRQRMASETGLAMYRERCKAECPNAWARRMGLDRLLVRGTQKARTILLWFALAHNMLRGFALRRAAAAAAA
jgi:Transposase DDE domain